MPTQKQILQDRLQNVLKDKKEKRAKKAAGAKGSRKPPSGKENANKKPSKVKEEATKERKKPAIQWAKAKNFHLTDSLVTLIEENARYRQAFGFVKEAGTSPTTGGETLADLYTKIARELLVEPDGSTFEEEDLPDLQKVVSNRVAALKKGYRDHREELGETGQGLVDGDKTDEIQADMPLANVWDRIQAKFPWYQRINKLFGTNPAVDRSAIANSQTAVDISILDVGKKAVKLKSKARASTPTDDEDDTEFNGQSSHETMSAFSEEDHETEDQSSEVGSRSSSPPILQTPAQPLATAKSPAAAPEARGTKRKVSYFEQITEAANQDRSHRLKVIALKEKERSRRTRDKFSSRQELELARMAHQQREAALQRQHDLEMAERHFRLEELRQQNLLTLQRTPPVHTQAGGPPPVGGALYQLDPTLHLH